jgi:hypothetical protein
MVRVLVVGARRCPRLRRENPLAPTSGASWSSVILPEIVAPWANTVAGTPTMASTTVSHLQKTRNGTVTWISPCR